jgi:hypothetical protein
VAYKQQLAPVVADTSAVATHFGLPGYATSGLVYAVSAVLLPWDDKVRKTALPCVNWSWLLPSAPKLELVTLLRGARVVASAIGMLHCRGEVERRRGGMWLGRLEAVYDVVTWSRLLATDEVPVTWTSPKDRAQARLVFGRLPNTTARGSRHGRRFINGLRSARSAAVRARAAPAGRRHSCAALIMSVFMLPLEFWPWHEAVYGLVSQARSTSGCRRLRDQRACGLSARRRRSRRRRRHSCRAQARHSRRCALRSSLRRVRAARRAAASEPGGVVMALCPASCVLPSVGGV